MAKRKTTKIAEWQSFDRTFVYRMIEDAEGDRYFYLDITRSCKECGDKQKMSIYLSDKHRENLIRLLTKGHDRVNAVISGETLTVAEANKDYQEGESDVRFFV